MSVNWSVMIAYKNLAEEINKIRVDNRLSVPQMAAQLKMSYQGLRKILNGETRSVQDGTIRAIEEAFKCKMVTKGNMVNFVPLFEADATKVSDLDDATRELIKEFKKKSPSVQKMFLNMIKSVDEN